MAAGINDMGSGYDPNLDAERRRRALLGQMADPGPAPSSSAPDPQAPTNLPLRPPTNLPPSPHPLGINDAPANTPPVPGGPGVPPLAATPNSTGTPTPGPSAGRPGPGATPDQILAYIGEFAKTHPGANPSIANDPSYWARRIQETHPDGNVDWGYWEGRFMQPEGPPEGATPGPAAGPATGPGQGAGPGNYYPPELGQFYAAQTAQMQAQQARQAQIDSTMRDSLLSLMNQGQQPVGDMTNDPGVSAYRNAQWQAQGRGRDALAERAAFLGLNPGGQGSGSFETSLQGQQQDTQNAIAGYTAQRTTDELQNRRQMLVQGLQIAQSLGARTEANSLQRELAMIDANLRQQGLGFNYAQLGQQQGQFQDTTALSYAQLQAQMNRDALLAGLNG